MAEADLLHHARQRHMRAIVLVGTRDEHAHFRQATRARAFRFAARAGRRGRAARRRGPRGPGRRAGRRTQCGGWSKAGGFTGIYRYLDQNLIKMEWYWEVVFESGVEEI